MLSDLWALSAVAVVVAVLACASDPEVPMATPALPVRSLERASLALGTTGLPATGVGEVLRALDAAGLRAANAPCGLLRWTTPGWDASSWARLDAWVRALQTSGIRDLELCVDFAGRRSAPTLLGVRSPLPPRGQQDAFVRWIGAVVERYDADGTDDMEDLAAPVNRVRLGSDLGPGGVEPFDEFPELLGRVRTEMFAASATARLVLPPLRARGDPPGTLAPRLELLAADPTRFDAWSLEASGSARELDDWLAWLAAATPAKPVQIVGGTTNPLAEAGTPARCDPKGPAPDLAARESERCGVAAAFSLLLQRAPEAVRWARAAAARDVVQKGIVAASWGVTRAELASVADSGWWTDPSLEAGAGLAAWSGLLEAGSAHPLPALFALRQLDTALRDREQIARLSVGRDDVALFALDGEAGPVWVAWLETPDFIGPEDRPTTLSIELDVDADQVRLEPVISAIGTSKALVIESETSNGRLWIELTPTPLFVFPD